MLLVPQRLARELLQVVIFFVAGVVRADDRELAVARLHFVELVRRRGQSFRPRHRLQVAVPANHRRLQALRAVHEIGRVAALDAQELAVDARAVAIVAANDFVVANAQRGLAAIGAMRANGADVLHFPGTRLIAIRAAGERAHRANVDAHAALVALQMIEMIGLDHRHRAAVADAQRLHAHAFVADAHAAVTQNAARLVVKHHGRPLFFVGVQLLLQEAALAHPVAEGHVLQLALAALVAHRAIQRMVGQQKFERALARLVHLRRIGVDHHALGHRQRAGHLQLGRFFHFHQAHAAGGLQRQAVVVAERRNFDANALWRR